MDQRLFILGIPFDRLTLTGAVERAEQALRHHNFCHVVTPGPEFVVRAQHDVRFRNVLKGAQLSLPDGFGIIIAARVLGLPRLTRITGNDFMEALANRAARHGWGVFLYSGTRNMAEQAAAQFVKRFPGIRIVGVERGYRKWIRLPDSYIAWRIRRSQARILLVALGAPLQELWIERNRARLGSVSIALGVGGALDFLAGVVPRAPGLLRRLGLEWLWRLAIEPRYRFRRILTAVWYFPWAVMRHKISYDS